MREPQLRASIHHLLSLKYFYAARQYLQFLQFESMITHIICPYSCNWSDNRVRTQRWLTPNINAFKTSMLYCWSLLLTDFMFVNLPNFFFIETSLQPPDQYLRHFLGLSWTLTEGWMIWVTWCTRLQFRRLLVSADYKSVLSTVCFVSLFSHSCALCWWSHCLKWPSSILLNCCLVLLKPQEGSDIPYGENTRVR